MFADRAKIYIRSGKGGDGHVSFRRELYVPNGGPDGGDGGKGGDVIFEVDKGMNALTDYRHKSKYAAGNGEEGGKKRCHGANGKDIVLKVPEGTVIKEAESGKVIADMSGTNTRQVVLRGGRGGKGPEKKKGQGSGKTADQAGHSGAAGGYRMAAVRPAEPSAARAGGAGAVRRSGGRKAAGERRSGSRHHRGPHR